MQILKSIYNANWLIVEKLIALPISLIASIAIARYLGPEAFGVFSFLISAVYIFLPLMQFGLNSVLTREFVIKQQNTDEILSTALAVRLLASTVTFLIGFISVLAFNWVEDRYVFYFLLLLLAHMFSAFDVFNYWFESNKNIKPVAIMRVVVLTLFSIIKVAIVVQYESLQLLLIAQATEFISGYLLFCGLAARYSYRFNWCPSIGYATYIVSRSWWLILSGLAAALYMKIDQVMLGIMVSKSAVGIYSIAVRFSEISYFLPVAIVTAFFPYLMERKQQSQTEYTATMEFFLGGLFWLGIVVALVLSLIAPRLIVFLYGEEYGSSASILVVHVWGGVFVYMRALLSKWLIIEDVLYLSLLTQGSGAIVNVALNFLLIPDYGALGAAWATLASLAFACWLSLFFSKKTVKMAVVMTRAPLMFPSNCLSFINKIR